MTIRKSNSKPISEDELMAMDDDKFFDYLAEEIGPDFFLTPPSNFDEPSEPLEQLGSIPSFEIQNLEFDEQFSELSSSPEDQSSALPNSPESVQLSNPPNENYEAPPPKLDDLITLVPETSVYGQTLTNARDDDVFPSYQHKYTIYRMMDKDPAVEPEPPCFKEHHLGASFNPSRRVDVYRAFVRQLTYAELPFSYDQRRTIDDLGKQVESLFSLLTLECENTPTNFRDLELKFKTDLDLLLESIANMNFTLESMVLIHQSIRKLIKGLELWVDRDPMIPIIIPGTIPFFVDPAFHLIVKLQAILPIPTTEIVDSTNFDVQKDLHVRLVRIFAFSKYPFTSAQRTRIWNLERMVNMTTGNPDSMEDKEFLRMLNELAHDCNYENQETRVGLSNPKKVKRAFRSLIEDLIDLGYAERKALGEVEDSHYIVYNVLWQLTENFIPQSVRIRLQVIPLCLKRNLQLYPYDPNRQNRDPQP